MTSSNRVRTVAIAGLALWMSGHGLAVVAQQEILELPGLRAPVEIVTDRWGISHIYAENEGDLFFAQGYAARGTGCFSSRSGGGRRPGRWLRFSGRGSSNGTSARGYIGSAAT